MATARIETPAPKPTRTRTLGSQVGSLINQLTALDEAEQAELAQSPATIRAKYEARRQHAKLKYAAEVVEAAERAVGKVKADG